MIQIVPLPRLIGIIATVYAVFVVVMFASTRAYSSGIDLRGATEFAFAYAAALQIALMCFFSFLWKWLWRIIPPLNQIFFPNLEGKWRMKIDYIHVDGKSGTTCADAVIRQSFYKISMEVSAKDSSSVTISADAQKHPQSGRPTLFYIFRVTPKSNTVLSPQSYDGAASLQLSDDDVLSGNYFTEANTRGHYTLTRAEA